MKGLIGPPTVSSPSGYIRTDQPLSMIFPMFSRLGLTDPSLASGKAFPNRGFMIHHTGFFQR